MVDIILILRLVFGSCLIVIGGTAIGYPSASSKDEDKQAMWQGIGGYILIFGCTIVAIAGYFF